MKNFLTSAGHNSSKVDLAEFTEEIDIRQYWLTLRRHSWLPAISLGSGLVLSAIYLALQPKIYRAEGRILVRSNQSAQLIGINNSTGEVKGVTQNSNPLSTEAEILKSQPVLQAAARRLTSGPKKEPDSITAKVLLKGVSAKPIAGTDILKIQYEYKQADTAASVVNNIMQAYIENNVQVNRSQAIAARQFILAELPQTENAVRQAEQKLRQFREANNLIALEKESQETVQNISLLKQAINRLFADLAQVEAKASRLRRQIGMDVDTALLVNAVNQSTSVQKSLQDWRAVQADLSNKRTIYQDNHPEVLLLREQVEAAQRELDKQVQDIIGRQFSVSTGQLQLSKTQQDLVADLARTEVDQIGLRQKLASLSQSHAAALNRARAIPSLEETQRELKRQVDAANTTYKTLLTKLQEIRVAENQNVGIARIISNAIPPDEAVGPRSKLILLGSGIIGLLFGVALAFLADYADSSIKTLREVRNLMPYPIIGTIPNLRSTQQTQPIRENSGLAFQETIHSSFQETIPSSFEESFEILQTNLHFSPLLQQSRSIMITSAMHGEGKSTVAANLALSLAQGGQKVLLVDADLRHGEQHFIWNINNLTGLSNVLLGEISRHDAINLVSPNLYILTSGSVVTNSRVLLDSRTMSILIEQLVQDFDFVIFDTPPLIGNADSLALSHVLNLSLLVMRIGLTNPEQAKALNQLSQQSAQKTLGIVVNGIDVDKEREAFPNSVKTPRNRKVSNSASTIKISIKQNSEI